MTWSIKEGDLDPSFGVQLTVSGEAVDLTGKTVVFRMRDTNTGLVVVERAATIVDTTTGHVEFQWADGDTDVPGLYRAQFEVTSAGRPRTFPADDYLYIRIVRDA